MSSFKIDDILSSNKFKQHGDKYSIGSSSSSCSSSSSSSSSSSFHIDNHQQFPMLNASQRSIYEAMYQSPLFASSSHSPYHQEFAASYAAAAAAAAAAAQQAQLYSANASNNIVSNTTNEVNGRKKPIKSKTADDANSISSETSTKLKLVNKYAKKIDELNESSLKKAASDKTTKSKKKKKKSIDNDYGHCSCNDLACSLSSVIDQSQLPMCLRGTTEEQLHLASLFNTLMHHKKCRRTRTVFTDLQLIGLEKRFENQKYLSTPDRIQLAESLGLSQLQVKTWYQNRRMKWKKKVLKEGSHEAPTKPKGRPKKNSIPSFSEIIAAAAANAETNTNSTSSSSKHRHHSSDNLTDLNENMINSSKSLNDDDEDDDDVCCDDEEELSDDHETDDESDLSMEEDGEGDEEEEFAYNAAAARLNNFIKENGFNFVK